MPKKKQVVDFHDPVDPVEYVLNPPIKDVKKKKKNKNHDVLSDTEKIINETNKKKFSSNMSLFDFILMSISDFDDTEKGIIKSLLNGSSD